MAEPTITNAEKLADLTLNGSVKKGDVLAHNGTGWVQADASDAATNLYAQYVAMQSGVSSDIITGCKVCVLFDADAPYTANATQYVSATAGAITETRPAANADVIQIVGRSISTKECHVNIKEPWEEEVFIAPGTYDSTGEPGLGVIDSPVWVGPALDTDSEEVYFTGRFPSGVLSVAAAKVIYNDIAETAVTIGAALIVVADGATNTGDTGTAHATAAPTGRANNVICSSDISAMFDADALKANYNFTVEIASTSSNGNLQVLGLYMRYLRV